MRLLKAIVPIIDVAAISPVLLGAGEHLLAGIDLPALGYQCSEYVMTPSLHCVLTKRA